MDQCLSAPLSTTINITDKCNLACAYCYSDTTSKQPTHMPTEKVIETVKWLHDKGVWKLMIAGGEPFLHPEILIILERLLSYGVKFALLSNGVHLKSQYDGLLDIYHRHKTLLNLQISLDSSEPSINDLTRGKGEMVLNTIQRLIDDRVELQLAAVITKHNVRSIPEMIRQFYPAIKRYHIMNLMPSLGTERCDESLRADEGEIADLMAELQSLRQSRGELNLSLPQRPSSDASVTPEMNCPGCVAGFTRMDINANGDVVACHMAWDSVMGNLFENSIEEIWHSAEAERFRRETEPLCRRNRFRRATA